MKKIVLFFPIILVVSACGSLPELDSNMQSQGWIDHQASINKVEFWKIKGRAAVRDDSNSASYVLHWEQFNSNYELRLISSLGQGTYLLKGSEKKATIQTPKNKIFTADTAEQLIQDKLGWDIHLAGLKYWLRGIPEPNVKYSQLLLDAQGRLSDMKQSGFTISILRYAKKKNVSLPEKVFIRKRDIQLRLVIQNWEI